MLFASPRKIINRDHVFLASTGITKAGYLLKRQTVSQHKCQWESSFVILNDHCISYCGEKYKYEKPQGNLLLTASTRVYQQNGEEAVIRIETGFEVLFLKGKDSIETKEWNKSIQQAVVRLRNLARGQFGVLRKGRVNEHFFMIHRECITSHPSFSQTIKIDKIYPLTESSTFKVKGNRIDFKAGIKGQENLTMVAKNDIELKRFVYALDRTISSLRNDCHKSIVSPPDLPVHSGTLLSLDPSNMKWMRKYLVLTEDSIYIHGHRKVGFDVPQIYFVTPNSMIFSTTLRDHSFELVLFSESLHLAGSTETEKTEWMFMLQKVIPKSLYDLSNQLQVASLERAVNVCDLEFQSEGDPGLLLERRGNWALAAVVTDSISRKISQGSALASIEGKSAIFMGFESVVDKLSLWKPPLRLSFWLSPQKMGWLMMMNAGDGKRWKSAVVLSWEKAYATVSLGVMTLYTIMKKDGKSKKRTIGLYGSAIGLVAPELVASRKNCFRIVNGIDIITLQASSHDDMMDWSTVIAHGISMENGGGLLLDKLKKESTQPNEETPRQQPSIFRAGYGDWSGVNSIVFSKSIKVKSESPENLVSPLGLRDFRKKKGLDYVNPTMLLRKDDTRSKSGIVEEGKSFTRDESHYTSKKLDILEHGFGINASKIVPKGDLKSKLPVQKLRKTAFSGLYIENIDGDNLDMPWFDLEVVSSTDYSAEVTDVNVFDKYSDLNGNVHINTEDFIKLCRYTECITGSN